MIYYGFSNLKIEFAVTCLVFTCISLFAIFLIIFLYIRYKEIRNFAFKLVFYLCISDFFQYLSNFLVFITFPNKNDNDKLCKLQAFLRNYFSLASFFWTTIISYNLYRTVVKNRLDITGNEKKYLFIAFGIPIIFSSIPLITDDYGPSDLFCWIKTNEEKKVYSFLLRVFTFYIILWFCIIYNIITITIVIKSFGEVNKQTRSFMNRLRFYPLVLLISWTAATVYRVYRLFEDKILWFSFLYNVLYTLQGLLDALVYGFNKTVKDIFLKKFCWCFANKRNSFQICSSESDSYSRNNSLLNAEKDFQNFCNKTVDKEDLKARMERMESQY